MPLLVNILSRTNKSLAWVLVNDDNSYSAAMTPDHKYDFQDVYDFMAILTMGPARLPPYIGDLKTDFVNVRDCKEGIITTVLKIKRGIKTVMYDLKGGWLWYDGEKFLGQLHPNSAWRATELAGLGLLTTHVGTQMIKPKADMILHRVVGANLIFEDMHEEFNDINGVKLKRSMAFNGIRYSTLHLGGK